MKPGILPIPPKGLIVAVDLSKISLAAWEQAVRLGAAFAAPLEVVFVNEQHPTVTIGNQQFELTSALKRQVVRDIHRHLGQKPAVHVLEGTPVNALRRFVSKKPAHWLIMGTHGRTGFRRFLGSVAEAMALHAPIPILTLRKGQRNIKSILAPVKADQQSGHSFQFAAELAWRLGARLTPIHVYEPGKSKVEAAKLMTRLESRLPAVLRSHCSKPIIVSGKVEAEIVRAAARYDLIVLRADRKIVFSEIILGWTTARILRFSPTPVLVLPADLKSRSASW